VAMILASMSLAGAALAQSAEQPPEDEVRGEVIRNEQPEQAPDLLPRGDQPDVAPGVLPFTGADLTLFVVVGAAAVAGGALIVRKARSRA
jgi:LPXTG-motif cell wall-anchored protein